MKAFEIFVGVFMTIITVIGLGAAFFLTYLFYIRVCGKNIIDPAAMVVTASLYVVLTKMTTEDYISNIKELLSE